MHPAAETKTKTFFYVRLVSHLVRLKYGGMSIHASSVRFVPKKTNKIGQPKKKVPERENVLVYRRAPSAHVVVDYRDVKIVFRNGMQTVVLRYVSYEGGFKKHRKRERDVVHT